MLRLYNWFYAHTHGYFWLPCPICKKGFGGHELHGSLMHTTYSGGTTCIRCKRKAIEMNIENYPDLFKNYTVEQLMK
jgi:hypothetical protein